MCVSVYVFADPIKTNIVGGDFRVQNSLTLDSLTEREIKRKHNIITAGGMWQKHTHTHAHTHRRDEKKVVKRGWLREIIHAARQQLGRGVDELRTKTHILGCINKQCTQKL